MAGMSTYLANKVLEHSLGQVAFAMPSNVWLSVFTADPTDAGLFTNEVTAGTIARLDITSLLGSAGLSSIQNDLDIILAVADADWGTITHTAIFDTGVLGTGNMLYSDAMLNPVLIENGDDFKFKIGKYIVNLD